MHAYRAVLLTLLLAGAAVTADARTLFQCKGSIIELGQTVPEVLARCGEPDSRERSAVPVRAVNRLGASYVVSTATLEHWLYNRRGGQFPVFLTFDQGRLRHIEFIYRR